MFAYILSAIILSSPAHAKHHRAKDCVEQLFAAFEEYFNDDWRSQVGKCYPHTDRYGNITGNRSAEDLKKCVATYTYAWQHPRCLVCQEIFTDMPALTVEQQAPEVRKLVAPSRLD